MAIFGKNAWAHVTIYVMIEFRTAEELEGLIAKFDLPPVKFVDRLNAGPDEELYFYDDKDGNHYAVWSRDYMTDLAPEEIGLKEDFNITVSKWIKLRKPEEDEEYIAYYMGDNYAVALIDK